MFVDDFSVTFNSGSLLFSNAFSYGIKASHPTLINRGWPLNFNHFYSADIYRADSVLSSEENSTTLSPLITGPADKVDPSSETYIKMQTL